MFVDGVDCLVLMFDYGDNCMLGGLCDMMDLFEVVFVYGFDGIVSGLLCDFEVVVVLIDVGVGVIVMVLVGNCLLLYGGVWCELFCVMGIVCVIIDGEYVIMGLMYIG